MKAEIVITSEESRLVFFDEVAALHRLPTIKETESFKNSTDIIGTC